MDRIITFTEDEFKEMHNFIKSIVASFNNNASTFKVRSEVEISQIGYRDLSSAMKKIIFVTP